MMWLECELRFISVSNFPRATLLLQFPAVSVVVRPLNDD